MSLDWMALCSVDLFLSVLWWIGSCVLEVSWNLVGHRLGAPDSQCHDCTLTTCQRWYCSGSPPSWPCSMQLFGRQEIRSMTVTWIMQGMFTWLLIIHRRKLHTDCFQNVQATVLTLTGVCSWQRSVFLSHLSLRVLNISPDINSVLENYNTVRPI
jgi:hypothetical protein